MAKKKYASLASLRTFLENLKEIFSPLVHTHKISDLTDYTVDSELSSTSTNPVQNSTIDAEFNAISDAMGALELAVDGKANATHNHDDLYYTEAEIDTKLSGINDSISNITSGTTKVADSTHADSADHASSADTSMKATQDGSGNVIVDTYETKEGAEERIAEALAASQADWDQTDETAIDFIKNKPNEEDAMELMYEMNVIDPAAAIDGSLYTDKNGVIYTLI